MTFVPCQPHVLGNEVHEHVGHLLAEAGLGRGNIYMFIISCFSYLYLFCCILYVLVVFVAWARKLAAWRPGCLGPLCRWAPRLRRGCRVNTLDRRGCPCKEIRQRGCPCKEISQKGLPARLPSTNGTRQTTSPITNASVVVAAVSSSSSRSRSGTVLLFVCLVCCCFSSASGSSTTAAAVAARLIKYG